MLDPLKITLKRQSARTRGTPLKLLKLLAPHHPVVMPAFTAQAVESAAVAPKVPRLCRRLEAEATSHSRAIAS